MLESVKSITSSSAEVLKIHAGTLAECETFEDAVLLTGHLRAEADTILKVVELIKEGYAESLENHAQATEGGKA